MNISRTYIIACAITTSFFMQARWPFSDKKEKKAPIARRSEEQYPSFLTEKKSESSSAKKFTVHTTHAHLKNSLDEKAVRYLSLFGVEKEEFTQFKGSLQQSEINDVLIDLLNNTTNTVMALFTDNPTPLAYVVVDLIVEMHKLNKQNQLDQAPTMIETIINNKEENIARLRTIINNDMSQETDNLGLLIFNNLTQDLSIYSTQLLFASVIEMMVNEFIMTPQARTERLGALLKMLKQEFFAIYHPVTEYQQTLIEESMQLAKAIIVDQYESFLKKEMLRKEYKCISQGPA